MERLLEHLLAYDEIEEAAFNEQFRDLEIVSNYKGVDDIIENCISELKLNLRIKERRAYKHTTFEKRYFALTNFDAPEGQVFLTSYLSNDETVRNVEYNTTEHILTLETSDPFIYNKINYVTKGMEADITVEEIFASESKINIELLSHLLALALFICFASVTFATHKNPSFITEMGWVGMYAMLVYYLADKYYDDFQQKRFFTYPIFVILTTLVMLILNYHLQAIIGLAVGIWFYILYREINRLFTNRILDYATSFVSTVRRNERGAYKDVDVLDVQKDDVVLYTEGQMVHFNGIVLEGKAKLDTTLMSGNEELVEVISNQRIESGSIVSEGGIEVKVEDIYHQTALYRLHSFSPKELHQHGYLEKQQSRIDIIFSMALVLLGIIIMIVGVVFSDIGQHHFIMSGLVLMYICYPLGILKMRPLFYQALKQISLKYGVIFLNENSLNRFIELAKKKDFVFKDDEYMKFHRGGYNVADIITNYTIIYDNEEDLQRCEKLAYRIHELWITNKYILLSIKLGLALLFLSAVFNFYIIIAINTVVNFVIIYRSNRVLNQIM